VTYAPGYLDRHPKAAEAQLRREIALPTPLHAADLQFQAFAEFDEIPFRNSCPALVLTRFERTDRAARGRPLCCPMS
jgi:hypothetical protein